MNVKRILKGRLPVGVSISLQISIFLVIIAFVPVATTMALKTYERQLLEQAERSNVQQARLVSASLSNQKIERENALNLLRAMNGRFDARIRILDSELNLLADSATLDSEKDEETDFMNAAVNRRENVAEETVVHTVSANDTFVYRLLSKPARIYRKYFRPPVQYYKDYYANRSVFDGTEIKSALEGKYGAATRISGGQTSVNLYSAVPIMCDGKVSGVVLVSRSTYRILQNLYELRLDLGKVFLWSLLAVFVIAVFLWFRISLPLKKLSRQASGCADRKGRVINTEFAGKKRKDEIGELSRSFASLVERLKNRIHFTESFASDVSHEFKNPLAAIRSCTDVLSDSDLDDSERKEFVRAINEEVDHLQNLLTGVRNITKIDGDSHAEKQNVNLHSLAFNMVEQSKLVFKNVSFEFVSHVASDCQVDLPSSYVERILDNLLSNAASFGTKVSLSLGMQDNVISIVVEDNGKGILESEKENIFNRFYSNRPESEKTAHTGLGLATVKAIVESMDGKISVGASEILGGAQFSVSLHADFKD